jgi:PAS domain S-box-containing protein
MNKSSSISFASALVVLLGSAIGSYYHISKLVDLDQWVVHTQKVLAELAGIRTSVIEAEIVQRTYLATGREDLLKTCRGNLLKIVEEISDVRALVADNAEQQANLQRLHESVEEYAQQFESRVEALRITSRKNQPKHRIDDPEIASEIPNQIRKIVAGMEGEERDLLAVRSIRARRSATLAYMTVAATTILGITLLGMASLLIRRDVNQRRLATEALEQAHRNMERKVVERTAELGSANNKLQIEVDQHQLAEKKLRLERKRYLSLVKATTAIVWNTPASGEIVDDLPTWAAFTGQAPDETRGSGWLNAIHPDDRAHTALAWSKAVKERSNYVVEHRMHYRDGTYRPMLARAVPLLDEQGNVTEWVGVHIDLTEQKRAEAAVLEARDTAEAANRAKSEFLANMSHEIRTPMNGIMGMTDIALDTELTRNQRECLEAVKLSANSLMTIINDILDFSKIEAGKVELDPYPFLLRDSLADMMTPLAMRANARGLELAYHVASDVPDALIGDWGRICQVIVNLIGNALKFTYEGQVLLNIETTLDEGKAVQVHFTVKDTGVGIPESRLKAIFEPFTQVDGSTTRKFGGTGLGLSISLKLVELMGGRIWAESVLEKGTTFHFTLRLEKQETSEPEVTLGQLESLRVLLAGGSATQKSILTEMLTQWRMRLTAIALARDALRELERARSTGEEYAILLLDLGQQLASNQELLAHICSHAMEKNTPVVVLKGTGENVNGFPESPTTIAIEKPVRQSRLLEAIQSLVLHPSDGKAPVRAAEAPAATPQKQGQPLRVLLVDDNRINQRICARLLERDRHNVTIVSSGEEALATLASDKFDVCLMDVQMPGMDGLEATMIYRGSENGTGRHLHMIALTAHAMKGDRERCLEAGLDDYLSKPIRPEELRKALDLVQPMALADR